MEFLSHLEQVASSLLVLSKDASNYVSLETVGSDFLKHLEFLKLNVVYYSHFLEEMRRQRSSNDEFRVRIGWLMTVVTNDDCTHRTQVFVVAAGGQILGELSKMKRELNGFKMLIGECPKYTNECFAMLTDRFVKDNVRPACISTPPRLIRR
jgi:hypothetical protein